MEVLFLPLHQRQATHLAHKLNMITLSKHGLQSHMTRLSVTLTRS